MLAIAVGSVPVPPGEILQILSHRLFGSELPETVRGTTVTIMWNLRLPRSLLALLAGAALAVSGAVMQSVLRNPLASSYTLGVSSGASLGACLVFLYGLVIPLVGNLTLPLAGFVFGLVTILLAVATASRIDGQMENNTIILVGMVFSLFVSAITTLLMALSRETLQRLVLWQMGSFAMRDWQAVQILAPIAVAGIVLLLRYHRELDMMTFGEEQALTMGVATRQVKWVLLVTTAAITGSVVAFAGVIGFVDLVAPHVVRRLFGSSHRLVLPMSAVLGGAFMVICDLIARIVVAPVELPVGAVTAIIGAPFFTYIFFQRRAKAC